MTIAELFLALYVTDFMAPESQDIKATIEQIKQCNALPDPAADCKNALRQYLQMKEKIGRSNADVQ